MRDPLFSGVTHIEISCAAEDIGISAETFCALLARELEQAFDLPVTPASAETKPQIIPVPGALQIAVAFSQDRQSAQLTWGNSMPMAGVARSRSGSWLGVGETHDEMEMTVKKLIAEIRG